MVNAVASLYENRFMPVLSLNFSPVEKAVNRLLERIKNTEELRVSGDPITRGDIVSGGMNCYYLLLSVYDVAINVNELKKNLYKDGAVTRAQMMSRIMNLFTSSVSLCGTCASAIHWAHHTRLISVGKYAPLFNLAGLSCSFFVYAIQGTTTLFNVAHKKRAILAMPHPGEHKKELLLSLVQLTVSVGCGAFTALKLNELVGGAPVSGSYTSYARLAGFSFAASAAAHIVL